jgi:hypothetical protein
MTFERPGYSHSIINAYIIDYELCPEISLQMILYLNYHLKGHSSSRSVFIAHSDRNKTANTCAGTLYTIIFINFSQF